MEENTQMDEEFDWDLLNIENKYEICSKFLIYFIYRNYLFIRGKLGDDLVIPSLISKFDSIFCSLAFEKVKAPKLPSVCRKQKPKEYDQEYGE